MAERRGVLSLWLFIEADDPANAEKDVLKEYCGVDDYDLDFQEGVMHQSPTPIAALLEPLSFSNSFKAAAAAAAEKLGIHEAYGVLSQLEFAYNPAAISRPIAKDPLFLGVFNWHR